MEPKNEEPIREANGVQVVWNGIAWRRCAFGIGRMLERFLDATATAGHHAANRADQLDSDGGFAGAGQFVVDRIHG